ncbi:MAG: glycosyltransferase family 4 protein [Sedimenticola sp.]|nr:glycosyltransferase family 4 protein [Sedimenticola sp.]
MSRLTILQMVPALESGGVERGTLEIARALATRGHRSMVISSGGRMVDQLQKEGSEHFSWPVDRKSPWTLRLIWPLRRFLREQGVDVLHYRSRVPGWVAYLAWRGMPVEARPYLVSTVHGLHSVSTYSAVMTRGQTVIAVSDTVRRYILENYPNTDPERIKLIYRGVDPAQFPYGFQPGEEWMSSWQSSYPQLARGLSLGLPGRLTRLKGHRDFLQILADLRHQGVDANGLIIGGEDPRRRAYARQIRDWVEEMGLRESVIFTGMRDDMREVYSQCDVVMSLSTRPESFGRTVLEALSLGRPVIGYDHGGVGEVLAELYPAGRIGLGDVDGAVKKLLEPLPPVMENRSFLIGNMISQTLGLYESAGHDGVSPLFPGEGRV